MTLRATASPLRSPRSVDLEQLAPRELDAYIQELSESIDHLRDVRRGALAVRNLRELVRSAKSKLLQLTPEERAALQQVEASEPERL